MCNAWNHGSGCGCGFGGGSGVSSWGTGTLRLTRVASGNERPVSNRTSLSELAMQLGHSLVVAVNCRRCGALIYLFAAPDGGFVIFDELGPPWPKHKCFSAEFSDFQLEFPLTPKSKFKLPVPASSEHYRPADGTFVTGIVVAIINQAHPRNPQVVASVDLLQPFRRRTLPMPQPVKLRLICIQVADELRLGDCVRGQIVTWPDVGTVLQGIEILIPPSDSPTFTEDNEHGR